MPQKELTDLQTMLASVQNRFALMNDKSVEASEIARALEELISTVAVHRIRAEMRNSRFPFELKAS